MVHNKPETFDSLGKKALQFFGELKNEILQFKQSKRIDDLFSKTEEFVQKYGKDVTTHQLRNIFHDVKKAKDIMELKLLRPNLAYIAGRLENENGKTFVALIDALIKEANEKNIDSFKEFMEAIIAYHKFYGRKN